MAQTHVTEYEYDRPRSRHRVRRRADRHLRDDIDEGVQMWCETRDRSRCGKMSPMKPSGSVWLEACKAARAAGAYPSFLFMHKGLLPSAVKELLLN